MDRTPSAASEEPADGVQSSRGLVVHHLEHPKSMLTLSRALVIDRTLSGACVLCSEPQCLGP
jgi:hypothetical protein